MAGGRPTKFDPAIAAKIVQAIQAGNYMETAASYAGINKVTLYDWLKQGARDTEGPLHEFSNAVQRALAHAEVRDVALIAKAAEEDWKAAAWRLERKFSDRWGRKDTVNVMQRLAREMEQLSDAELLAIAMGDSPGDAAAAYGAGASRPSWDSAANGSREE